MKRLIGFVLILILLENSAQLSCPESERAVAQNLHYPTLTSCADATASAEAALTSYHYRNACKVKYGLATLPASVGEADVIDCFVAPAPGWSTGTVVAVEVCCNLPCEQPWTPWYDRDNPSGTGDFENLGSFLSEGKACENPCEIQCQTLSGAPASSTGENIVCTTDYGFRCKNSEQPAGTVCSVDYKVRFRCPLCEGNWTPWLDRDNPSGSGDWDHLASHYDEGNTCENPCDVQCRQKSTGIDASLTGEIITCTKQAGFICKNADQPDGFCKDYEVRFKCP